MNQELEIKLKKYVESDQPIAIYTDNDADSFIFGWVVEMDDNYLLLNDVSSRFTEDGFTIINTEDIFMFGDEPDYTEKFNIIFALKKQTRRELTQKTGNPLIDIFEYAQAEHALVMINNDRNYIGYVTEYTDEVLSLRLYDDCGRFTGNIVLETASINSVYCMCDRLRDAELLINMRKEQK